MDYLLVIAIQSKGTYKFRSAAILYDISSNEFDKKVCFRTSITTQNFRILLLNVASTSEVRASAMLVVFIGRSNF
jgi:hypothetical protein